MHFRERFEQMEDLFPVCTTFIHITTLPMKEILALTQICVLENSRIHLIGQRQTFLCPKINCALKVEHFSDTEDIKHAETNRLKEIHNHDF